MRPGPVCLPNAPPRPGLTHRNGSRVQGGHEFYSSGAHRDVLPSTPLCLFVSIIRSVQGGMDLPSSLSPLTAPLLAAAIPRPLT